MAQHGVLYDNITGYKLFNKKCCDILIKLEDIIQSFLVSQQAEQ